MRQLLDHAAEHGYGVRAFNVNNLEQTRAIMEAVNQTNSPVINEFGGEIPETYGVPVEQIQEGIRHGVRGDDGSA